tara:strand:+ start:2040 stop:2216 length:177 start_codon:yes stop_codon:yes gene_type:complete
MDFSKMSDQEVLEKMNEVYGEYTLYWHEYAKRTQIQKNKPKVFSDGRGGYYEVRDEKN